MVILPDTLGHQHLPVKSITISSQKGGVGKTTLAINLAYSLAREGHRTLLIDTDPQGSVGLSLTRQSKSQKGFYDFLENPHLELHSLLLPTRLDSFWLIPSGKEADYDSGTMGAHLARVRSLFRLIRQDGFDFCIIDTAAGLFGATSDVVTACDALLIPQQAEPLGIRSVPRLLNSLERNKVMNPHFQILGLCMTMVHEHLPESVDAVEKLRKLLPNGMVFRNHIPRDEVFLKASAVGVPVGALDEGSEVDFAFHGLRDEVLGKLSTARSFA